MFSDYKRMDGSNFWTQSLISKLDPKVTMERFGLELIFPKKFTEFPYSTSAGVK